MFQPFTPFAGGVCDYTQGQPADQPRRKACQPYLEEITDEIGWLLWKHDIQFLFNTDMTTKNRYLVR